MRRPRISRFGIAAGMLAMLAAACGDENGAEPAAGVSAADSVDAFGASPGKADDNAGVIDAKVGQTYDELKVEGFAQVRDKATLYRAAKVFRLTLEAGETIVVVARRTADAGSKQFDPLILTRDPDLEFGPSSVRQSFLPMADSTDAAVVLTAQQAGEHLVFIGGVDFRMGGTFRADFVGLDAPPKAPWTTYSSTRRIALEGIAAERASTAIEELDAGRLVEGDDGRVAVGEVDSLRETARLRSIAGRLNDRRDAFFAELAREAAGVEDVSDDEIDAVAVAIGPVWVALW